MPITLKDIAEKAQVSQAAVSIAMGSSGRIAEKTRERILKIAEEMGYRPNMLVHGIQTGRTMTIGVLVHFGGDVFEMRLFNGIHDTLAKAKYVPIVLRPCEAVHVLGQIHSLIDRRVDGILLRPAEEALWEKHLDEALNRNVPVVAFDIEPQAETPHIDFVGTDDIGGARMAAEMLLDTGHRRLAVITAGDLPDGLYFRREGFEKRIGEHPGAACHSVQLPWSDDVDGYDGAMEIFALDPRPTAIFVTMDSLAPGVYRAAKEMGLDIPGDVSVVGFADNPIAQMLNPKLTTIHQSPEEVGQRAAELLLERIAEGDAHGQRKRVLLTPDWSKRDSVAPPSAG